MPSDFFQVQNLVMLVLGLIALGFQGFALVSAITARAAAFPATSNQTKPIWLGITGVCFALGFVSVTGPLNIFNLLALVGAGVYLTRVRPAIQAITGKGGSPGPYGSW